MNQKYDFKALIQKYQQGTCTDEEKAVLESWVIYELQQTQQLPAEETMLAADERIGRFLDDYAGDAKTKRLWPRVFTVAAAVAAITFGIWFFSTPRHPELVSGSPTYANDVAPGKNTAVLIVNGKQTQLSEAKLGIVINDDIKYNDSTNVISSAARDLLNNAESALTLITPKGGTYSIILQDGTKVWLNADSKLEVIPNFWNKTQRLVRLTGEAYFEVAKNARRPFRVESQGQRVTVLGTHFNINAYPDEPGIKTTLLEGSVKVGTLHSLSASGGEMGEAQRGGRNNKNSSLPAGVSPRGGERILKPNQQSLIAGNNITVTEVDPAIAIAWKNKQFLFTSLDIQSVMRMVARWYNVEVIYQGSITTEKFSGGIPRFEQLSKVLRSLESTGQVAFKIEGRKLYVSK